MTDFSKYLDEKNMIASVQKVLSFPSVAKDEPENIHPYGDDVFSCLEYVLKLAEEMGFQTSIMDNRVGWAEWGEGEEMVAVVGHLDTVPVGNGWTKDPYKGEIVDGKLYGRGAIDDKGPIISALYALKALKDSGFVPSRKIRILFGCNEENGCDDIAYYVQHGGQTPVLGFTPDGEYPLIHGEKGIVLEHFVCDISDSEIASIEGGNAENMVPDFAKAELKNGEIITAEGISAHGSTPERGKNAIVELFRKLSALPIGKSAENAVGFVLECIGDETDGTSLGANLSDEVSGKLTLTLGTAWSDGKTLDISINYRYPVTKTYEDAAVPIHEKFDKAMFKCTSSHNMNPLYYPKDSLLIKTLIGVYNSYLGVNEEPITIGGGTYAKTLPNIVAFGPIFPGEIPVEHEPDEFIEINRLIDIANLNALAIEALSK